MDTNLYALEQLVADRLAHARGAAARRGVACPSPPRPERRRRGPARAARTWLGLVLIELGRVLAAEGPAEPLHPHARARDG